MTDLLNWVASNWLLVGGATMALLATIAFLRSRSGEFGVGISFSGVGNRDADDGDGGGDGGGGGD